jgi:hypothetical protein
MTKRLGRRRCQHVRFSSFPTASQRFEFANGNNGFTSNTLPCVPSDAMLLQKKKRISTSASSSVAMLEVTEDRIELVAISSKPQLGSLRDIRISLV